jgi:hypothetical protein
LWLWSADLADRRTFYAWMGTASLCFRWIATALDSSLPCATSWTTVWTWYELRRPMLPAPRRG